MKVNIENASLRGSPETKAWVLEELVRNLKELRDRHRAGDEKAFDEFFEVFTFIEDANNPSPQLAPGESVAETP